MRRLDVAAGSRAHRSVRCEQLLVGARIGHPQVRKLSQHALRNRHVRLLALPPRLGVARARGKEAWVENNVVVVAHHNAHVGVVNGDLATRRRREQVRDRILFTHLQARILAPLSQAAMESGKSAPWGGGDHAGLSKSLRKEGRDAAKQM